MITDFQKLAVVYRTTGKRIKLGLMETVSDYLVTDEVALISIARAQVEFKRGTDLVVTRRGYTMFNFVRQSDGSWLHPEPVTFWHEDREPEVYVTFAREAQEYLEQREYEAMCYRPGTPQSPMDGPNAQV